VSTRKGIKNNKRKMIKEKEEKVTIMETKINK